MISWVLTSLRCAFQRSGMWLREIAGGYRDELVHFRSTRQPQGQEVHKLAGGVRDNRHDDDGNNDTG